MRHPKLLLGLSAAIALGVAAYLALSPGTRQEQVRLLDPAQVIVLRTPGGLLEVATLNRIEEFGWQTTYTCPLIDCGKLLGATVTRLRVPVHYTYRVALAASWELRPEGKGYVLEVPAAQPALPPAIDTSKLEIETNGAWTSPGRALNVESTLRQLGPELERRALRPDYLAMQEPHAAKTVAEFARQWMQEQKQTPPGDVRVAFKQAPI